jgi:glycosyltransferase involved in cell wall biosynthesis
MHGARVPGAGWVLYRSAIMGLRTKPRAAVVHARTVGRRVGAVVRTELDVHARRDGAVDLAVFHDDAPPPSGGGNQFLRGLVRELESRGLTVERNRISRGTPVCLFNSFNFDFRRLRRFHREGVRMVHRVDGPIRTYRGFDDGSDGRIERINAQVADATVFQSRYSLEQHATEGIELVAPVVIPNAPDPQVFHPPEGREPLAGRPLRVVTTSWSTNPAKGAETLAWLDRHLDHARVELTYVGGEPEVELRRIRMLPPRDSRAVAEVLRAHDVFFTASRHEACSNALLEGLACGLPAVYVRSGSNAELVGEGGIGFDEPEELPGAFEDARERLSELAGGIRLVPLHDVADRYADVLWP